MREYGQARRTVGTTCPLDFTLEQVQNTKKPLKRLMNVHNHPGNSKVKQLGGTCCGLAYTYRATTNTTSAPAAAIGPATGTAAVMGP